MALNLALTEQTIKDSITAVRAKRGRPFIRTGDFGVSYDWESREWIIPTITLCNGDHCALGAYIIAVKPKVANDPFASRDIFKSTQAELFGDEKARDHMWHFAKCFDDALRNQLHRSDEVALCAQRIADWCFEQGHVVRGYRR